MRCHRAALGGLLLATLLCLPSLAQRLPVTEVRIDGLTRIDRAAVQGLLQSRQGAEYSEETARTDLARVVSLGLFDPTKCEVSASNAAGGVTVLFHLVENPVIASLQVRGVTVAGVTTEAVAAALGQFYRVGEVFNLNAAGKATAEVARIYDQAGYEATLGPPAIGEDGAVIAVVSETRIEDVVLNVWPPTEALDLGKLVEWIGLRLGSPLAEKQLGERRNALMGLGLFSYLAVDLLDGQTGVIVRFSAVLNDYPVPSADALPFLDPLKLLRVLAVYRVAPPPYTRISEPRPTPKLVAALTAAALAAPQDGGAGARAALALYRARRRDEALAAAKTALPLLEAAGADAGATALRARLLLLQGDATQAYALLNQLRQAGSLPPEGYAPLVQAAVAVLAQSIIAPPGATGAEAGASLTGMASAMRILISVPDSKGALATPAGTEYASALGGAWVYFQKLDDASLAASHDAFERFLGILSLLEYLPPELAPSTIVPDSAQLLAAPATPSASSPRLLDALEKRSDDPEARYAWSTAIIQRELAIALGPPDATQTLPTETRSAQLTKAQEQLAALVASDPARFAGAQGLLALGYVLRKEDDKGLGLLETLLDGDDVPDADHLYLLAASIATTREPKADADVQTAMQAIADRLSPLIADAQPRPRARYARYSLLAWAGQIDKATDEARAATVALPNDEPAWAALGFFEGQRAKYDDAEPALRKALELNPNDLHASYALGLVTWAKSGDGASVLPLLARLNEESPIDLAAWDIGF